MKFIIEDEMIINIEKICAMYVHRIFIDIDREVVQYEVDLGTSNGSYVISKEMYDKIKKVIENE